VPRFRVVLLSLVIAASATGCAGTGAAPSPQNGATASSFAGPNATPIASTAPASAAPASAAPPIAPTVTLTEWSVVVAGTIKAGKTQITSTNSGVIQHEMLIFKSELAASAYPTDPKGDIKEEGKGITLVSDGENIDPAGSQVRDVDLTPGTYLFLCNIPGHFKAGMFTVVTVAP
jgi:uncharacterized cupredoxin-like copper-binding protein